MNSPRALCLIFSIVFAVSSSLVDAADQGSEKKEVTILKTKDGLNFKVPPDWPVEERNGVVGPIPIEEYLAQKFASLEKRIRGVEQQTTSLELRVHLLEEEAKKKPLLQSGERTP